MGVSIAYLVGMRCSRGDRMVEAFCVKCRKKVEIKNPEKIIMKNKRPAIRGTCPYCGTKVFKIGA